MKHNTSDVVIYTTTDYSKFSMISGNRSLNDQKIKRIIKEIEGGNDMLKYYPIQVHTKGAVLEILDGQHRFFISKRLKRPVYYILVQEQKSMPEIAMVNSNVEKWSSNDYINCYISAKNENYKKLRQFIDLYKFSTGVCLSLLSTGTPGKSHGGNATITELFQKGKFLVKTYNEAVDIAEMVKRFDKFSNWRGRLFILAIYRIREAGLVSIDDLVTAFEKNPGMLTEQANFKDYIVQLEQILNVGKHKRVVIA